MNVTHETCDVCVIGGGPAGSTAATFIAMKGHRVVLIDKQQLPAYKIGESLLPATIHGVCAMLGVTNELRRAGFVRKHGGTFLWGKTQEPWTFSFAESSAFAAPTAYAYQVERIKFDEILLENARRRGVDVRLQQRATGAVIHDGRVAGVEIAGASGERTELRCRYVVDASGHEASVAHTCGERIYSAFFRNVAVFGYYRDGKRLPPPRSGNIFCAAFDKGWFWYIPLSDTLTSVGAVIGLEHTALLKGDHDAALRQLIAECPAIDELLAGATRSTAAPYDQVRVRKDYSYTRTKFWTPGLVLIGDAACFIDPVFSSGVHLATYSALLAARSINSYLTRRLDEHKAFAEFEARYRREFRYFHEFLLAFYDTTQDLGGYFWSARKVLDLSDTPKEAFIRLVGGAASGGDPVADPIDGVRQAGAELRRRMPGGPGDAPAGAPADGAARNNAFWFELNRESVQMQLRAAGTSGGPESALRHDGLVPSRDGLEWEEPGAAQVPSEGPRYVTTGLE
jgi:halogenation protein CepH